MLAESSITHRVNNLVDGTLWYWKDLSGILILGTFSLRARGLTCRVVADAQTCTRQIHEDEDEEE